VAHGPRQSRSRGDQNDRCRYSDTDPMITNLGWPQGSSISAMTRPPSSRLMRSIAGQVGLAGWAGALSCCASADRSSGGPGSSGGAQASAPPPPGPRAELVRAAVRAARRPGRAGELRRGHGLDPQVHAQHGRQRTDQLAVTAAGWRKPLGVAFPGKHDGEHAALDRVHGGVAEQHPGHPALALDRLEDLRPALPDVVDLRGRPASGVGGGRRGAAAAGAGEGDTGAAPAGAGAPPREGSGRRRRTARADTGAGTGTTRAAWAGGGGGPVGSLGRLRLSLRGGRGRRSHGPWAREADAAGAAGVADAAGARGGLPGWKWPPRRRGRPEPRQAGLTDGVTDAPSSLRSSRSSRTSNAFSPEGRGRQQDLGAHKFQQQPGRRRPRIWIRPSLMISAARVSSAWPNRAACSVIRSSRSAGMSSRPVWPAPGTAASTIRSRNRSSRSAANRRGSWPPSITRFTARNTAAPSSFANASATSSKRFSSV